MAKHEEPSDAEDMSGDGGLFGPQLVKEHVYESRRHRCTPLLLQKQRALLVGDEQIGQHYTLPVMQRVLGAEDDANKKDADLSPQLLH